MSDLDSQPWAPKHNPWLIAITVSMATFMEVLDTSVANVALPHIAGSFGASQDESTWVPVRIRLNSDRDGLDKVRSGMFVERTVHFD